MKYNPTFDQIICLDLELKVFESMLLNMMVNSRAWAKKKEIDNKEYYFLNYNLILDDLPVIFQSKASITRVVKILREKGLVETIRVGRSNYFYVSEWLIPYWGRDNKDDNYVQKVELFRKLNVQETEQSGNNRSESETIKPIIVQEVEPINQLYSNQPTNNNNQPTICTPSAKKKKNNRFVKPTIKEIKSYCEERKNNIDAEHFYDSNESRGWVVGKTHTPMKNWKAAIRTWERSGFNNKPETIENHVSKIKERSKRLAEKLNNQEQSIKSIG